MATRHIAYLTIISNILLINPAQAQYYSPEQQAQAEQYQYQQMQRDQEASQAQQQAQFNADLDAARAASSYQAPEVQYVPAYGDGHERY